MNNDDLQKLKAAAEACIAYSPCDWYSEEEKGGIFPHDCDLMLISLSTPQAILALIAEVEQARAANGWISVLAQLPEKYTEVLVWPAPTDYCQTAERDDKGFYYGEYLQNYGHTNERLSSNHVTHWQPLPAAPQ